MSRTVAKAIKYGSEEIPIEIDFGRRKNLYINVKPDQSVIVKAPVTETLANVMKFVRSRAAWIFEHRLRFKHTAARALANDYAEGGAVYYLGERYELLPQPGYPYGVGLESGSLVVDAAPDDAELIRELVAHWYKVRAREVFAGRLEHCRVAVGIPAEARAALRVRKLKCSWGNCSSRATITLSPELVRAPLGCIDYVITHELCHLRHHNHSRAFYSLLTSAMPDWRDHKDELERYQAG